MKRPVSVVASLLLAMGTLSACGAAAGKTQVTAVCGTKMGSDAKCTCFADALEKGLTPEEFATVAKGIDDNKNFAGLLPLWDILFGTYYGGSHVDGGTSRFDKNGIVYQGVDEQQAEVAIKTLMLSDDASEQQGDEARFRQEARAGAQLRHPNVISILDAGREVVGHHAETASPGAKSSANERGLQ